jgi:hypothetical protein
MLWTQTAEPAQSVTNSAVFFSPEVSLIYRLGIVIAGGANDNLVSGCAEAEKPHIRHDFNHFRETKNQSHSQQRTLTPP